MKRTSLPYLMTSGGRTYFRRAGALVRLPDPDDPGFLAMIKKYSGRARQIMRARQAAEKRNRAR